MRPEPTAEDTDLLLPDLVTTLPDEVYLEREGDVTRLRFSTPVENLGRGPLELRGDRDPTSGETTATQLIERTGSEPREQFAGRLVRSDEHRHWHLEDFALFELWPLHLSWDEPESAASEREDDMVATALGLWLLKLVWGQDEPVASQRKITFCLIDEVRVEPPPEHVAEQPEFIECEWQRQGLSEGWRETYVASLPGQSLDITSLPSGFYVLRTTVDPDDMLAEANEDNNSVLVPLHILEDSVRVLAN